eukprot:gene39559-63270_t
MGVTAVVDENQQLIGIITDGDLRRMLEKTSDISTICASDILSTHPITVQPEALAVEALELLKKHDISQLIVAENGIYKDFKDIQMNQHHYVAIMAGGIGSRFWPQSRTSYPKQFLDILNTCKSLIRWTYERYAAFIPNDNIFI